MPWVHAVIDVPASLHASEASFWSRALGWEIGPPWAGHRELRSFVPAAGAPYVHLQEIRGAPRVHLDLESHDRAASVEQAGSLGAELVAVAERWTTMSSPGRLLFCVLTAADHRAPPPTTWPDRHRSRLVQVCVDSPAAAHDHEVEFWRTLLAGRWVGSGAREFAGKWHDDAGSPVQLLFQRLDEPDGDVRAHLDLGTDDLAAEVTRLRELGADDIGPGRGWHALRDPAGLAFCATENSPDQTEQRDLV